MEPTLIGLRTNFASAFLRLTFSQHQYLQTVSTIPIRQRALLTA